MRTRYNDKGSDPVLYLTMGMQGQVLDAHQEGHSATASIMHE